ncbi:PQQ-binding-like beta-propeller repeat protein [Pedobacter aquatilis]|uniref:outer membrane protein assembly factor BamB family protein n=1 Tax=Pedobacter aquatilis TaxID=351343 RepID=UPI00292D4B51|nr:PQQ-binding-like beta-propeller repeat protein [Pedobacter aquatilis]
MNRKVLLLTMLLSLSAVVANAQFGKLKSLVGGGKAGKKSGNFKTVWESDFANKATRLAMGNEEGTFILGTDDNSATVLNAEGKPLWDGDYKKLTTNKTNTADFQYYIHSANGGYLFLFDRRKMGTDRIAVLDVATGKELWNSENYQNLLPKDMTEDSEVETVKYIAELDAFMIAQKDGLNMLNAKTGEKIWETKLFKGSVGKYIYDKASNQIVMVNFKPTALAALFSGFKNQLVKINAANGEILWDATFRGVVEKELVTRKAIVDLNIVGDKLFMWMDGIQCFNLANGQKIWDVTYENDISKSSNGILGAGKKRTSYYHGIADPIYTDNAVYIVIMGNADRSKFVEKHDLQTGKLIWTSEKITGAFVMPNIYKTGNRVMVQVGGKVEVQELRWEEASSGASLAMGALMGGGGSSKQWVPYIFYDYKAQKNGILSLDDATGKTVWRSEKFDKRITDMIIDNDKTVFVGDGDEFYSYNIETGNQLFDVKHNDAKVGRATDVIDFGDDVVVLSEKGLASYKKSDGKRNYASEKIKGVDYFYHIGDNYFLRDQRNSKNIIYGIDMTNGETKGMVESKGKGGSPKYGDGIDITADGEYIFAFKGKKVEKIKVNN